MIHISRRLLDSHSKGIRKKFPVVQNRAELQKKCGEYWHPCHAFNRTFSINLFDGYAALGKYTVFTRLARNSCPILTKVPISPLQDADETISVLRKICFVSEVCVVFRKR